MAPIVEEFVFEACSTACMKKFAGPWSAMATNSLIFAAIHQNLPALPAYFLLACGFTLAYERHGLDLDVDRDAMLFNSITVIVIFFFPQWIR